MEELEQYEERVWREWREHPEPAFVAVDSAGRCVGGLRLAPDDAPDDSSGGGQGWKIGIGVAADTRHQGVGWRLMEAAITYGRTTGATYLALFVDPTNAPAIALYRRIGFIETGEKEGAISMRLNLREIAS
jgi:ribosomal protein S18 acetylase RimI-like enzyme